MMESGARKKTWVFAGVAMIFLSIIMVITMVILNQLKMDAENNNPTMNGGLSPAANAAVNEYMTEIEDEMAGATDEEEKILIFQKYLNEVTDDEVMVVLLNERINFILDFDFDKKFGSYVIDDVTAIDSILKTLDSARQVWNFASYYGNKCVMNEYQKVINERGGSNSEDDSEEDGETLG